MTDMDQVTIDLKMLLNSLEMPVNFLEMSMNLLLCMFLSDVRLSICAAWLAFAASCLAICACNAFSN